MKTNAATKEVSLTQGPLLPRIILFSLPLMATAILQLLFNTADTIVVGRWGGSTPEEREIALAAVGSCGALINLIVNLFFGLAVGAGVSVAHDIGAGHSDRVGKTVHTAVLASLICGVVLTVFGIVMARPLLLMMDTDPAVLGPATLYMRAYFCGMPANILYNYCASMLRSTGDTTRPLVFLSTAGVVNVLLNLITVLVFHMGAMGVGIATAASHWISCILILLFMMRTDGPCHLDLRRLRLHKESLYKIVMIGLPAGLQGTLFSLSNTLIQSSINSFGKVVVAGNTAGANLDGYIYATQNTLYHTALTFVGQNTGAGKFDRVKQCIWQCTAVVGVVGLAVGLSVFAFGEPLLRIYAPDSAAVVAAGMTRLAIIAPTYFLCGFMEVGCGVMRGLGESIKPMIVSLLGSCAFRILWIYTVFALFPTQSVLYLSYPISWGLTAAAHFVFCHLTLSKREAQAAAQASNIL